jgi:predicted DNA-binding transcriptional regulator AlpA
MPEDQKAAFTINVFCQRQGISRSTYYKLKRANEGPQEMRIGGVIRISRASEENWMADIEQASARPGDGGSSSSDSGSGSGSGSGSRSRKFVKSRRGHRRW